jgi:hypothetical protein
MGKRPTGAHYNFAVAAARRGRTGMPIFGRYLIELGQQGSRCRGFRCDALLSPDADFDAILSKVEFLDVRSLRETL